ncbi:MAG: type II toxin-antitoxin system RelE/ParE family toxin [Ruminococcus flavefaciens]|nr:type II toxin-antitoxin system RelE/ParE family toxin [Ruminococcus flavefaciens]
MSFDVQISKQADQDLRDIYEYIAFELLAPENAVGQLERLEEAISKLDNMPEKYSRYEREPWRGRGLRVFPVDHYLVFYISDMETKVVTVIRVMYGGRDVDKQLKHGTEYKE